LYIVTNIDSFGEFNLACCTSSQNNKSVKYGGMYDTHHKSFEIVISTIIFGMY